NINMYKKKKINTRTHSVMEKMSHRHMIVASSPICSAIYLAGTSEIDEQSGSVHFDRYDYTGVDNQDACTNVYIICKYYGPFMQTPKTHKNRSGCPDCAITIGHTKSSYLEYCNETDGNTHLYLIECHGNNERFYKVGIAKKGANNR